MGYTTQLSYLSLQTGHVLREVSHVRMPVYLVGPTGSGKSALAVALAQRLDGEIVNADAFQIYRGLDICTAKPSEDEKQRVPHHLYDVLAITEPCDAQFYSELAKPIISEIQSRGKTPIIVGGSGLYVKALTHGLASLPPADEGLREKLACMTASERVTWLLLRDPMAEKQINLRNDRYVSRALEVCILTGRPQSELRNSWQQNTPDFKGICLIWDRALLYERINQRVLKMIDAGLINEIGRLGTTSGHAFKAIGVREMRRYLNDECTKDEAVAEMQQATRNYAKRQMSWFRRETAFKRLEMTDCITTEEALDQSVALLEESTGTLNEVSLLNS